MATRKQITYSKRHRPKTRSTKPASPSSVNELEDSDQYLSHSELSRRLLKRARLSPNMDSSSISKRLIVGASSQSSRPDASPSRRPKPRISSRNLKENASARGLARNEKNPKSPAPSLRQSPPHEPVLPSASHDPPFLSQNSQSPSDRFSVNFQTASTKKKPSFVSEIAGIPFSLVPGDVDHHFFADAQGSSTPAPQRKRKRQSAARVVVPPPAHHHHEPDLVPSLSEYVSLSPIPIVPRGMKALPTCERSPWLSDSIISPPRSDEWERIPQQIEVEVRHLNPAPKDLDVEMGDADDISLGLGLTPFALAEEDADVTTAEFTESRTGGSTSLISRDSTHISNVLAQATENRLLNSRTTSHSAPAPSLHVAVVDKKHTLVSAVDETHLQLEPEPDVEPVIPVAADPSPAPVTKAKAPVKSEMNPKPKQLASKSQLKSKSKPPPTVPTVVLPKLPLKRAGKPPRAGLGSTPDELDVLDLTVIPVSQRKGKEKMAMGAIEEDEEEEDELLLKPGFNVWE